MVLNIWDKAKVLEIHNYDNNHAKVKPNIVNKEVYNLIISCFHQSKKNIFSLKCEDVLIYNEYFINDDYRIKNFIGKEKLEEHLDENTQFNNIKEVYKQINTNDITEKIYILDSAAKSSKSHGFKGRYKDVYNCIMGLQEELEWLKEGISDIERTIKYKVKYTFDISPESNKTMSNPRCQQMRIFTLPDGSQKTFEWHIKIGSDTRIHYYLDKENSKIYIGHCGGHLPI